MSKVNWDGPPLTVSMPAGTTDHELAEWWIQTASADLRMLLPKVAEYSAHDLRLTGEILQELQPGEVMKGNAAELTCWFYLLSKVTRAIGAIKEGHQASDDTIQDVRVYATMIARIREFGGWPA